MLSLNRTLTRASRLAFRPYVLAAWRKPAVSEWVVVAADVKPQPHADARRLIFTFAAKVQILSTVLSWTLSLAYGFLKTAR